MCIYIHTHTCCGHGEGGERERVHERETDMRKPLTALPATHWAAPPWSTPKTSATRRQQRCCGSTGQPTKKPACLMAASTLDRCRRRRRRCPLRPGPSLLHLCWPSTPPFVFQIDAHVEQPMPSYCVYLSTGFTAACVCSVCLCVGLIAKDTFLLDKPKTKRNQRLPRQLSESARAHTHTQRLQTRTGHGDPPRAGHRPVLCGPRTFLSRVDADFDRRDDG